MPVKYKIEDIQNINTFEDMTKSQVIDYEHLDDTLYFVVKTDNFRKIIGKNGTNINIIKKRMNKNIIVYRHEEDAVGFAKNIIPVPVTKIELEENDSKKTLNIETEAKNKGILIGRGGKNLNIIKIFLKRQFNIDNIKIL